MRLVMERRVSKAGIIRQVILRYDLMRKVALPGSKPPIINLFINPIRKRER